MAALSGSGSSPQTLRSRTPPLNPQGLLFDEEALCAMACVPGKTV